MMDEEDRPLRHFFVYGTLKRGQCRESLWPVRPVKVQEAWVRGCLYGRSDYPALLPGEGRVEGELWECPAEEIHRVLAVLDEIEGTDGNGPGDLYHRHVVDVFAGDQEVIRAYTYFYHRDPIADGFRRVSEAGGVQVWP